MRWPKPEAGSALLALLLFGASPVLAAPPPEAKRDSQAAAVVADIDAGLPGPLRRHLVIRYFDAYDNEQGGLLGPQKTLDRDHTEYALFRAQLGDELSAARARQTLDAASALQDPDDGGFYPHSFGDWSSPEGEKSPRVQADCLRSYALAALLWPESGYLGVAQDARNHLRHSLPAEATADNGWAIEALTILYRAGRDPADLEAAVSTARWLIANRALPGGGFRRDARGRDAQHLGDTLAAGAAFLAVYRVTGERAWLQQASAAAEFLIARFRNTGVGYNHSPTQLPSLAENIRVTRFLNLLAHDTGRADFLQEAQHAMRFVSRPGPLKAAFELSGALLADDELGRDPLRITVIGPKGDSAARAQFAAGLGIPGTYQRGEWWDPAEGPLPNADVTFPLLTHPAIHICTDKHCLSTYEAERLPALLLQLSTIPD